MLTHVVSLFMAPLAFAVACLLVMLIRRAIAHIQETSQQPGLTIIRQLGHMLSQIHIHRDLCQRALADEAVDAVKIDLIQKDIAASINKIIGVAEHMNRDDRWMGMVEHWGRLSVHYHQLAPESCSAQHNRLLSNMLRVIDESAEYYEFEALQTEVSVLDKSWDSLLSLLDHTQQAHAIGQLSLTSGQALTTHKRRLSYIQRNMRSSLAPGHLSPVIESALRQPVEAFMACIDELTGDQPPPISATAYFRLANEAMAGIQAQFAEQMRRLIQAIDRLHTER